MKINVLELFAGSCTFSKAASNKGFQTFSTDLKNFENVNLARDILDIDLSEIPFLPDVIWASPPCTGFSVAALGHHWTGGKGAYIPATDTARLGIRLAIHTLSIIEYYLALNPSLVFFIENPRGVLRKMPFMQRFNRHTVWYCKYGDTRAKPTDIWTNSTAWQPRPPCKNGNEQCHHEPAPRGSRTGTQGLRGNYERSILPLQLCEEVLDSCLVKVDKLLHQQDFFGVEL